MRLYPRLAFSAIKRNSRLYIPYLCSCIGMTALYYIIRALSLSGMLGSNTRMVLGMGTFVIITFSLFFLCYTNAFLVRRRYQEFGLYSVLGMNRTSIGRIITWESAITTVISISGGLTLGIMFGKLAELGLMKAIGIAPVFDFKVPCKAVLWTVELFLAIHLILFVLSLIRVSRLRPLELMRSEAQGEKPPKANWLIAVIGVLMLAGGYFMAIYFKSPLQALLFFLIAVILVIAGTYLIFTAGSVTACRILQNNKKYYYRKEHFISTSSMAFRMKRNGAGLASICVLATMVLVMISSTSSLYFGLDEIIRSHCPMDVNIELIVPDADDLTEANIKTAGGIFDKRLTENQVRPDDKRMFSFVSSTGLLKKQKANLNPELTEGVSEVMEYDDLWQFVFITASEYNKLMGTDVRLSSGEACIATYRKEYQEDKIEINGCNFSIVGSVRQMLPVQTITFTGTPSMMLVISDYAEIKPLTSMKLKSGMSVTNNCIYYGVDLGISDVQLEKIYGDMMDRLDDKAILRFLADETGGHSYRADCIAHERRDARNTFGGFFFLGLLLSVAFILATVLIIYYKQISEGYEDQSRFAIMKKCGMTDEDIKKSINSQMLTVFFAPLIIALVHLCFAFPMIWRMLKLFALQNLSLTLLVTVIAFALFAVCYMLIYRLTTHGYYRIVSGTFQ